MTSQEQLRQAVSDLARDGNVTCKQLLELATTTRTPARQLGKLCDEMHIRITGCQLGCFG